MSHKCSTEYLPFVFLFELQLSLVCRVVPLSLYKGLRQQRAESSAKLICLKSQSLCLQYVHNKAYDSTFLGENLKRYVYDLTDESNFLERKDAVYCAIPKPLYLSEPPLLISVNGSALGKINKNFNFSPFNYRYGIFTASLAYFRTYRTYHFIHHWLICRQSYSALSEDAEQRVSNDL
jgi:hypothetical protein